MDGSTCAAAGTAHRRNEMHAPRAGCLRRVSDRRIWVFGANSWVPLEMPAYFPGRGTGFESGWIDREQRTLRTGVRSMNAAYMGGGRSIKMADDDDDDDAHTAPSAVVSGFWFRGC